jgi:hypothetical protein
MELNVLIESLLESGVLENQELGVTLLSSPDVKDEDKRVYIDKFIEQYTSGEIKFLDNDHKHLFKMWVDLYLPTIKDRIKDRVKKII